ncbi:MAG: preprotein translocase subunit SecG [Deltaproteobacteria bacterium]|nr:preprotein translocase subunit SecG [Deltaproteobacteria bacterium]
MSILLIVIHVVVCIALILIVLLQTGKGADMGAAFGGGSSQTLFGSTGASTFLSKATTVAAIVFMLTSLTLAYVSGGKVTKSVVTDTKAPIEQSSQTGNNATDTGSKSE